MQFIELSGGVILNLAAVGYAQWEPDAPGSGHGPSPKAGPLLTIHLVGAGPGGATITRAFHDDDAERAYAALRALCT